LKLAPWFWHTQKGTWNLAEPKYFFRANMLLCELMYIGPQRKPHCEPMTWSQKRTLMHSMQKIWKHFVSTAFLRRFLHRPQLIWSWVGKGE
jgi:hypothetical protein